ncbi:MAG: glycosyltransferase [Verrucomicrobia bacterium]|nr:glycosyltransferase [Verrucomicrobiota bacterium]
MKIVIFGLTISSSWGNGHATIWRGLLRETIARGHDITFFERDVPYYAAHRDLHELAGGTLVLYDEWDPYSASASMRDADVAIVTSYCPDGMAASELVCASAALRVFYDLDTPVTLARLAAGESLNYIPENGLADFDLALSFTGGGALTALQQKLGARAAAALYGSVDPAVHHPVSTREEFRSELSYLGTFAADRQDTLHELFIKPARELPQRRFVIGGAQYPPEFPWTPNIFFLQHLAPAQHPAFFCSSRLTLNVTRASMREMGWCPSGRLFEAAACGTPLISDWWEGLDEFFAPGEEILIAQNSGDVIAALERNEAELRQIAAAARDRVLAQHTAAHRATEFEQLLTSARTLQPLEV